jgi:uncharacterized protein (DUF1800 family)
MMIPDQSVEPPVSLSLTPYTGTWTKVQAAHLLRRTLFGPTFEQIQQAVADGMDVTVAQLLTIPATAPPLTFLPDETIAAFGTTWVNSVYPSSNPSNVDNARRASLGGWIMQRLNQPTLSIQEKMCLFWDNHFGVEGTFDARAIYNLHELYRANCLGNFKQLVKDVTVDPNMLIFLNGASNNQFAPNENYSRELLELFTVGKGLQVGPGDYSNYTESDVAEGAKILTGWTVNGMLSDTLTSPSAVYYPILHDATVKTLSGYFGNATISNADNLEYTNYIDVIFQQPGMAKFICRKLYRWFVNYDLTQDVEDNVIADMATTLEANNFDILPVMDQLLKSEHFYDVSMLGTIIKNPLECVFSMLNATHSQANFDLATNYLMYIEIYNFASVLGMEYFRPPSVGGWTSYYQAPSYTRLWANSSYIKLRFDVGAFLTVFSGIQINGEFFKVNALTFLDGLSLPSDAPQVIDDIVDVFCPKGLSAADKLVLKALLTNGLPDFEWTLQYNEYLANSGNVTYSDPVRQRVEYVLYRLFQMPQFQTI